MKTLGSLKLKKVAYFTCATIFLKQLNLGAMLTQGLLWPALTNM